MPRCQTSVKDTLTKKFRKCLNKPRYGPLCACHARSHAVKIQAAWRSYKARSKINTFKRLPSDLWGEVLNHIAKANRQTYINENIHMIYISHFNVYVRRLVTRMRSEGIVYSVSMLLCRFSGSVELDRLLYFDRLIACCPNATLECIDKYRERLCLFQWKVHTHHHLANT